MIKMTRLASIGAALLVGASASWAAGDVKARATIFGKEMTGEITTREAKPTVRPAQPQVQPSPPAREAAREDCRHRPRGKAKGWSKNHKC